MFIIDLISEATTVGDVPIVILFAFVNAILDVDSTTTSQHDACPAQVPVVIPHSLGGLPVREDEKQGSHFIMIVPVS